MVLVWREDSTSVTQTRAELTNYLDLCKRGLKIDLCVPAPQPFPEATVEIETKYEPADFFFAGLVFIVSSRMREILNEFDVKAEFLHVKTIQFGKPYRAKRYYFCNVLDAVDCFNYAKSEFETTPFGVTAIKKLVLNRTKAKNHHLFRVGPVAWGATPNPKAVRDVIRCASPELAMQIIESGLTGVIFTEPKDWRTYPAPAWNPHE